jgi:molecular chaperone GrpE
VNESQRDDAREEPAPEAGAEPADGGEPGSPGDGDGNAAGEPRAGDAGAAGATEELAEAARGGDPLTAEESERLAREIREELEELEELHNRHLRLAAEFENYRKRTRREMEEARERAQAQLAERLLDALDDLDRVLETPVDSTSAESLREGVEMVSRKLEKELGDAGLSRIEAEGEPFDPEVHEALLTTPVEDPEENDRVSRVLINGYTFGDRVIRPARVEVKKYSGGSGGGDGGDGSGDESGDREG